NSTGEPYTVHTNIFTQGQGNREQRFQLWFDPTADYDNYTIHWNPTEVAWYVDSIPIRVFRNYQSEWIAYQNQQGMFRARTCKWNGPVSISQCPIPFKANWWTSPVYKQLTMSQHGQLKWVQDNHMIYNYRY
nr:probable xyloglucan endotransglucosylase/hydrolase protein 26 [Tanacetum cinerariifolium]